MRPSPQSKHLVDDTTADLARAVGADVGDVEAALLGDRPISVCDVVVFGGALGMTPAQLFDAGTPLQPSMPDRLSFSIPRVRRRRRPFRVDHPRGDRPR